MLNVFKMDMRRIFHSKMFYVCLFSMLLVTGSMIIFGVAPDFSSIMGVNSGGADDMMGSMMGIGMAFMVISIFFTLFICQEFTSGFAKNIFARHANSMRYIGGKLLSLTLSGSIMLVAFIVIAMVLMAVTASIVLPGGIIGLIGLIISKIFSVAAFASLIIFACLISRKSVIGIIAGIVVAMGVIPMVLSLVGDMAGLPWIAGAMKYTISGLSNLSTLNFSVGTLTIIIVGNIVWIALFAALSNKAIKSKDV